MMYGSWGGWGWMALMPLLWIGLIGLIVWAVVALVRRPTVTEGPPAPHESAREILDRRYAAGEIDAEGYTRARDLLAGRL